VRAVLDTQENKFPVLVYHKIDTRNEFSLSVIAPSHFKKHIRHLIQLGYNTCTVSGIRITESPKPLCLFFDDAYQDIYDYGFPFLDSVGFKANLSVISRFVGAYNTWDVRVGPRYRHMASTHIRLLHENGWEICSHSCSHRDLTSLAHAPLVKEVFDSKKALEDIIGAPVKHFVYPFGRKNQRVIEAVKEAGYQSASGFIRNKKHDFYFDMPRFGVYNIDSLHALERKLQSSRFERCKQMIINRCTLGSILYQNISMN